MCSKEGGINKAQIIGLFLGSLFQISQRIKKKSLTAQYPPDFLSGIRTHSAVIFVIALWIFLFGLLRFLCN
jgi:hypothetical protein